MLQRKERSSLKHRVWNSRQALLRLFISLRLAVVCSQRQRYRELQGTDHLTREKTDTAHIERQLAVLDELEQVIKELLANLPRASSVSDATC